MIKPSQLAFVLIVLGLVLLAALLSSCALTVPLGEDSRYGEIRGSINYLPPTSVWENRVNIFSDK